MACLADLLVVAQVPMAEPCCNVAGKALFYQVTAVDLPPESYLPV